MFLYLCTSQARRVREKLKLAAPLYNGIKGTTSVSSSVKMGTIILFSSHSSEEQIRKVMYKILSMMIDTSCPWKVLSVSSLLV